MIIDTFKNHNLYENISENIAKAFAFIKETDLANLAEGKYIIDGDSIYASVMEYNSKDPKDAKLESHVKYIDVQYIISGEELMGYTTLNEQKVIEINNEKDCIFYEGEVSYVKVSAGMFAVFFPSDLHKPSISVQQTSKVKKVVIKIAV